MLPPVLPPTGFWGHIPFLFSLFREIKPENYVELGVHYGASFIAACSATSQFDFATKLYGVDTWEGDLHTHKYDGEELYQEVKSWAGGLGVDHSLLRKTFAEALNDFEDKSIEILLIDGYHTYEAVSNDFNSWRPKMKDNGIVLFHDIHERKDDFGVYLFWNEIKEKYRTIEFTHSHGLGVLFIDPNEERLQLFQLIESSLYGLGFFTTIYENIAHRMVYYTNKKNEADSKLLLSMLNSTSWKITRPLRWLKSIIS